ncbi:MAG: 30S ribosomal protein S3 [Patescibacteria group bacterium]|nr:30S ribosomal protein S3 [Patescibacteria group bacterium]MDE2015560.1 30S ribosomal protein S3 [Patescibacteria group bacterium]MDE2227244.1 30S ribosomal protein S3 [Patescibacteria group bacterium]
MGQKIHPISYRLGVTKGWPVRWFIKGKFGKFLEEDEAIRKVIKSKISQAGIAIVEIERTAGNLKVFIKAARPGFIIGRGGKGIEELNKFISLALKKTRKAKSNVGLSVNIEELKRSEISSVYVAQQIAWDLEKRMPFRRTIKKYIENIMQNKDIKGAKIFLSGRLDGNEIARREWLSRGSLPLQTLRSDIDYGQATAFTTYGTIGIKVWLYKGEIFNKVTDDKEPRANRNNMR